MEAEFADIKIGDKVSVEIPMFYWIEALEWIEAVSEAANVQYCTGIRQLQHAFMHKMFTPAFLKAATAHIEEQREQNNPVTIIRRFVTGMDGQTEDDEL